MPHTLRLLLLAGLFLSTGAHSETADQAIARATAAVQAATPRAQADPLHPAFHVTSPAQWMNDPNGPIYYRGYYHLFYQLHPFSDSDGPKYWGHVRSRDLVKWEALPIALAPSGDLGEAAIWSGCCTLNGLGQPMIFYTSIGVGKSAFDQAAQWAAVGGPDLIHWQKSPANPVLPEAVNGATKIYDWRDPFIFKAGKHTFLVTGGHLARERHAAVSIYEARNAALTDWVYRGPLFEHPDAQAPTVECPNFFQLGNRWVLLVSPYGQVQYFVGDFDAATCRFTARARGVLDYGSSFYAPNTLQAPDGRRLVWGWLSGFPAGRGWNGCLSLPRQLSLSPDGQLRQTPAQPLSRLRGKAVAWHNVRLDSSAANFPLPATNTLEIQADFELGPAGKLALEIAGGSAADKPLVLSYDGARFAVLDAAAPLTLPADRTLNLRIFMDRSVLEVFVNDTVCFTKIIPGFTGGNLALRASGGEAQAKRVRAWPMASIW
ncbi:MAG: glycoside hydrolase family 32 protein [Verrucomicrobiae bacterium]|nr:glycoside hydrolase family 32 protein [Verrucomicrobiae bacterium]